MKIYFDKCRIIELNEASRTMIIQISENKDWTQYKGMMLDLVNRGNPSFDMTVLYHNMKLKQVECLKCHGLTNYLVPMPKQEDYNLDTDEGKIAYQNATLEAVDPGRIPQDLKCEDCGEPLI